MTKEEMDKLERQALLTGTNVMAQAMVAVTQTITELKNQVKDIQKQIDAIKEKIG